jgi:hypothetical protein
LAKRLSDQLEFDLFYQEFIHNMAESAHVSVRLLETLDEKGASILEEWISSIVDKRHLWPDRYLQHLMKIIGTMLILFCLLIKDSAFELLHPWKRDSETYPKSSV